ncbi:MAG: hypothetical protein AAFQ79_19235, partial [Pseudomonadota bacterium]
MFDKIRSISNDIDFNLKRNTSYIVGDYNFYYNPNYTESVKKIIYNFQDIFIKTDLLLIVYFKENLGNVRGRVKEAKIKRIKPTKWVYHTTDLKNKDTVLKEGLKIKKSKPERWLISGSFLEYPNSIFASLSIDELFNYEKSTKDIWVINTESLSNKWWYDLNF